ncbi:hypothetical protein QJQ45_008926 [Haematococcus lacustris]|nr:hypothetical protein QJQ45_008926 [Haematococcus lacustris]
MSGTANANADYINTMRSTSTTYNNAATLLIPAHAKPKQSQSSIINIRDVLMTPLLATLASAVAAGSPQRAAAEVASAVAVAPGQTQELYDQILAYRFQYPVSTTSGEPLKMLLTHPPEKYSSAAPLTADARQRIVSELLELRKFVNINVCVGPASGVLKDSPPESWKPLDVALTVLIDRSTSRLTTGQRFALNDVEEAHAEQRPSGTYFVYEHRSQVGPDGQPPHSQSHSGAGHALDPSHTTGHIVDQGLGQNLGESDSIDSAQQPSSAQVLVRRIPQLLFLAAEHTDLGHACQQLPGSYLAAAPGLALSPGPSHPGSPGLTKGSPTNLSAGKESFRHALAVTGVRPDSTGTPFLYTLNLSCREEMWSTLQPLFKVRAMVKAGRNAVDSFVLEAPTDKYISPDTRPWQFW